MARHWAAARLDLPPYRCNHSGPGASRVTERQPSTVLDKPGVSDARDAPANMVRIPGGTFRMGSDRHYAEEAPAHRVTVSEFFIDRTPVTNRQFKEFVRATGHVTVAEKTPKAE